MFYLFSYLLQSPQWVHYRPDLLLSIKTQEFVHHLFHKTTSSLFEEEVEKRESSNNFVFLIKFNWIHLLHLPPLEIWENTKTSVNWEQLIYVYILDKKILVCWGILFSWNINNKLHLWLTDFAKLKKLFVSPVTVFDAPEKTGIKDCCMLGRSD